MNRFADRRPPAYIAKRKAQRHAVDQMTWEECNERWWAIERARSTTSACGRYTIAPRNQTYFQEMLAQRMAEHQHRFNLDRIEERNYCPDMDYGD